MLHGSAISDQAHVGLDLGRESLALRYNSVPILGAHDKRFAVTYDSEKSVTTMTENTNKRYEFMGAEWVKALRRRYKELIADRKLDFDCFYALEYTDPPKHLLRDDGRNTVGYTLLVKNGNLEVIDGALVSVADLVFTAAYDPLGKTYHMPVEEFQKWWTENEPRLRTEGKYFYRGDRSVVQKLQGLFPNNIYADLYNRITAAPAK